MELHTYTDEKGNRYESVDVTKRTSLNWHPGFEDWVRPVPPAYKLSRAEAYKLIDGERDYQDALPRNTVKDQRPMEHLAIIRQIIRQIEASWYNNPGQADMGYFRKIAAVAVRAMQEHGAPPREAPQQPVLETGSSEPKSKADWECSQCHYMNNFLRRRCRFCAKDRQP